MSIRKSMLCAGILLGSTVIPAIAQADDIIVTTPPPPAREEAPPAARSGYVWSPGYWKWEGGEHVWVEGHWIETRPNQQWVPDRWEEQDSTHYRFVPGHWENQ